MSDTRAMRLYARELQGSGDARLEVPLPEHIQLFVAENSFGWHDVMMLKNGQPAVFSIELEPGPGSLNLTQNDGSLYRVLSGLDADRLRLTLCTILLESWPAWGRELTRSEMQLIESARHYVHRLQDSFAQPDQFLYQVL